MTKQQLNLDGGNRLDIEYGKKIATLQRRPLNGTSRKSKKERPHTPATEAIVVSTKIEMGICVCFMSPFGYKSTFIIKNQ